MDPIFEVHRLNEVGLERAKAVAARFDYLLEDLAVWCGPGREFAIVKTKLEEACFFAKKSLANQPENQAQVADATGQP